MVKQNISYRWRKTSRPKLTEREPLPRPENSIPTHNVTQVSNEIIWHHRRSSWNYNQWTSQTNQGGFTKLIFPINALNKQKCSMRRAMRKPRYLQFKIFAAWLKELNNYLPLLPGSSASKKLDPKELNEILLQAVPKSWAKNVYIQGWDFGGRFYKETCKMFERMEIAEAVYEEGVQGQLPKTLNGQNPTVPVLAGIKRGE